MKIFVIFLRKIISLTKKYEWVIVPQTKRDMEKALAGFVRENHGRPSTF